MSTPIEPFKPAIGLKNRHLQTLYSTFFKKPPLPKTQRETFELADGDFVECFWHHKPEKDANTPIVVLFHGLAGSYRSPYIKGIMHALGAKGFASVLMHFRGCSGKDNRLPRSYHSGDTADAKAWIEHLAAHYPRSPLFGVGYSLGANMLLKLMGEWRDNALLKAAVAVSAPMQLDICANQMDKGFSKIYQAHLMKDLSASLMQKYRAHPMELHLGLSKNAAQKLKTFWEFDHAYTAPIHGFTSAADYYKRASARQYLKEIKKETLIIHALDDPFMTPEVLPKQSDIAPQVHLEVYPHGGHVGFIGGSFFKPRYWLEERIVGFFSSVSASYT
jgi:uncharacterized protein